MAEHLGRAFFEKELAALAADYGKQVGTESVVTELVLKNGLSIRVEGQPVCTDDYIAFFYKSGVQQSQAVLPYASIVGVTFSSLSNNTLGFHRS